MTADDQIDTAAQAMQNAITLAAGMALRRLIERGVIDGVSDGDEIWLMTLVNLVIDYDNDMCSGFAERVFVTLGDKLLDAHALKAD